MRQSFPRLQVPILRAISPAFLVSALFALAFAVLVAMDMMRRRLGRSEPGRQD
jgi:hypothetical protein